MGGEAIGCKPVPGRCSTRASKPENPSNKTESAVCNILRVERAVTTKIKPKELAVGAATKLATGAVLQQTQS